MRLVIFFLFVSGLVTAQPAKVLAVHDGDSFKVQFEDGHTRWVRLWGVDAPEIISNHITKDQPYGRTSGDNLRALIKGKEVFVDSVRTDVYNRMVAKVFINPVVIDDLSDNEINLSSYVIAKGWAWWYDNASILQDDLVELKNLKNIAASAKLGLWGLPGRKVRPSTFRASNWRP